MKRSIYAVLVILSLAVVAATAATAPAAANEPSANALGPNAGDEATVAVPAGLQSVEPLCPSASATGFNAGPSLPWTTQPQVGSPCCDSLCAQVCGVGEPCACKRCQVLGCGV